jgi:Flp pilus assembly protein TadB
VVGAVVAGERGSRAIASVGVAAAGVALKPAGLWWRSPLGAPVRNRVAAASDALERSGRELVARTSDQARVSGSRELKRLGDQLSESGLADEIIDKLLSSGAFDRIVTVVINHPATEALVVNVVDEPALERLVSRVMESRLVDGVTAQMQAILDYITRSPELRAALAHQTAGMAEDVAIGVRSRTYNADATAERFARRLLKRRSKPEPQQ